MHLHTGSAVDASHSGPGKTRALPKSTAQEQRCYVYFNLNRHCLSVRAMAGPDRGRVIAHAQALLLEGVDFKVSEAGRQRVLRERRRNVHAGMVGTLMKCTLLGEDLDEDLQSLIHSAARHCSPVITYNPYREPTFVLLPYRAPIHECTRVLALGKQVFLLPTD